MTDEKPIKEYIACFRQGRGVLAMNAIDYYRENGKIIRHSWEMGGEDFSQVENVPENIEGYTRY